MKKHYEAPAVAVLGTVAELTLLNTTGGVPGPDAPGAQRRGLLAEPRVTARQPYEPPTVTVLGTLATLTLLNSDGPNPDLQLNLGSVPN